MEAAEGALRLAIIGQEPISPHGIRSDYHWNKDYTAYWVSRARWYDDASYIAYQSEDCDDHGWHYFLVDWAEALDIDDIKRLLACEPPRPVFVPTPEPMLHDQPQPFDEIPF